MVLRRFGLGPERIFLRIRFDVLGWKEEKSEKSGDTINRFDSNQWGSLITMGVQRFRKIDLSMLKRKKKRKKEKETLTDPPGWSTFTIPWTRRETKRKRKKRKKERKEETRRGESQTFPVSCSCGWETLEETGSSFRIASLRTFFFFFFSLFNNELRTISPHDTEKKEEWNRNEKKFFPTIGN